MLFCFNWIVFLLLKHLTADEERLESRRPLMYASNKIRKSLPESDPYKLVPCRTFPSDSATPFTVTICLKSLLVMDFHSYLSSSEVIGLVGGKYYHASRRLEVSVWLNSTSYFINCMFIVVCLLLFLLLSA